jgi:hypothetical protein
MEVLHARCAGLDVHKETVVACVRRVSAPVVSEVRTFGTTTRELPRLVFSTRNYQSVTTLMPGAAHHGTSALAAETRVTYNGTLWRENLVFIDGVDVSITRSAGGSRLLLPSSALTEIRSDGAGYGAEYGRTSGGISSVVTKSGTSQFHGDFITSLRTRSGERSPSRSSSPARTT